MSKRFDMENFGDVFPVPLPQKEKTMNINHEISSANVIIVLPDNSISGATPLKEAIRLAESYGLDLIEVNSKGEIPVCKIADYGKIKYEKQKKDRQQRGVNKAPSIKTIKFRPNIADSDYNVKVRSIKKFLDDGDRVNISLVFKGREISHASIGSDLIKKLCADVAAFAKIVSGPVTEEKQILVSMAPKKTSTA